MGFKLEQSTEICFASGGWAQRSKRCGRLGSDQAPARAAKARSASDSFRCCGAPDSGIRRAAPLRTRPFGYKKATNLGGLRRSAGKRPEMRFDNPEASLLLLPRNSVICEKTVRRRVYYRAPSRVCCKTFFTAHGRIHQSRAVCIGHNLNLTSKSGRCLSCYTCTSFENHVCKVI